MTRERLQCESALLDLRSMRRLLGLRRLSRGVWQLHTVVAMWLLERGRASVWINLKLPSGASRRFFLTDQTQVLALQESFWSQVYAVDGGAPAVIVDLGANARQATVFLRDRHPDARIISVEADPQTAAVARRNLRDDPQIDLVAAAVTDHDGTETISSLAASGASWGSNILHADVPADTPRIQVSSLKLHTLLKAHAVERVDMMKVDIEGAEARALLADDVLRRVHTVVGELHPHMTGIEDRELLERFQVQGAFDRAELRPNHIFLLGRHAQAAT